MIKVVKIMISVYCNKPKMHIIISGVANKKNSKRLYNYHDNRNNKTYRINSKKKMKEDKIKRCK